MPEYSGQLIDLLGKMETFISGNLIDILKYFEFIYYVNFSENLCSEKPVIENKNILKVYIFISLIIDVSYIDLI